MAKRISELPAAGSVADTDDLEVNQSGVSPKATRGQIIAGLASAAHQHNLAEITDAGALAALDAIRPTEIDPSAYATQVDAAEGVDGTRIMTAERTAEAIAALAAPQTHQHSIADITDVGALAALDIVGAGEIGPNAVTSGKILAGAVTTAKLANAAVTEEKIADGAVGADKLQPGIPIDMQDAVLRAPELRDYAETSPAPVISSGALTLDLETGNVFEVILTEDVTSLILAHAPAAGRVGSCSIIL